MDKLVADDTHTLLIVGIMIVAGTVLLLMGGGWLIWTLVW